LVSSARSFAVLLPLLGAASLCSAANITYDVNLTIGSGSVSGQITTDGTLGGYLLPPNTPNIVDWNLLVSSPCVSDSYVCVGNPTLSWDLLGPLSGAGQNSGLALVNGDDAFSASPTELIFNFSAGNDGYLFFGGGSPYGSIELCFSDIAVCFATGGSPSASAIVGENLVVGVQFGASQQPIETAALSGAQVIATADTPEPSTGILVGVVALGAGLLLTSRTRTTKP
jgi:hypothetical protein